MEVISSFPCQGNLHSFEYLLNQFLLSDIEQSLKSNSFFYALLDMSGKMLILKLFERPEAEVHSIDHEQLKESTFELM